MPHPRAELVETLFAEAASLPSAACAARDESLACEIREMPAAALGAGDFMQDDAPLSPEIEAKLARLNPEEGGEMIGPYKLREQIGEGGFGTVWVADQEQPVRRRVALKVIKLGMDTKEVIARFEQERQALALMDHPNIAKILDAGATQFGRPFFVMELVRGVKITDYCDEKQLSTQERIGLFITVCQAVQHAHQKGIIHRDLKPSNILVTINDGKAVPKVIDFGVAKATQGRLTDQTVYTQFQQMIGTPLYMSPEQAELTSLDIDTRSDIYSLGVLLYELLTGHTPIETKTLRHAGMDEIRRIIREVDPPRPSMRVKTFDGAELTTAAKRRHTDAAKLPGALRGDIDWIVMKCLEKDRSHRYDTANGLALDLQRHLANEVVIARPPTTAYLLSKLIRRNKLAFAAGVAIAASLVIGIAASVWQAVRAEREAARARSAEHRAVAGLDELRATAPAFVEQARGLVANARFDEALEKLAYAAKLRPDAPEFLIAKGDVLQCSLRLAEAAAAYRAALALRPDDARAKASAALCDLLLAAPTGPDGKLTRESLSKLHLAMQQQQRPAAELMPVARLLGEEKTLIVAYWLARLKGLPISADKPLEKRLTVRDDGLLALDLSDTKVADLSPLAGMPLGTLALNGCTQIVDFAPLREFRSLTSLQLGGVGIADLSPLRSLRLEQLHIGDTSISDISALRGMPLKTLRISSTRVTDLSPLAGMPLTDLDASSSPASDYSPLAGAPLERCILGRSGVSDLSFLRGSPVRELSLNLCEAVRGFAVLGGLKSLELLVLPNFRAFPDQEFAAIGALRAHATLKTIGEGRWTTSQIFQTTQSKDAFWKDWDREQAFVPALRKSGFSFSISKLSAGSYSLEVRDPALSDLSFLKGAPISELRLDGCKVTDLAPLRDLPLRSLGLSGNPVADLSPLRGMRLERLNLAATKVSDLSPIAGLPLTELYLDACENLTDVSALAEIPTLEKLTVPINARNIEMLRKLPKLQMLAFQLAGKSPYIPTSTTEQFWKMWPGMAWARALNEAGMKYTASQDSEGWWTVTVESKEFSDCSIFKSAPIRELVLYGTSVADLRPLEGFALTRLDIRQTLVTDLTALRAPALSGSLRDLRLYDTKVTDFSPLTACTNLEVLDASSTALADLSLLRGRKLRSIQLIRTKVTDISVLAGMPLTRVTLADTAVSDLRPLLQCPTLNELVLPVGARDVKALRALPALTAISYDYKTGGVATQKAAEFWKEFEQQGWMRALRELGLKEPTLKQPEHLKQLPDGTWDVRLDGTVLSDLTILRGAPISRLDFGNTAVSDLTPLRGMTLKRLSLYNTKVSDLSPLQGMPLDRLHLSGTKVTDLSVLRGMPLTLLRLHDCTEASDLSPLVGNTTLKQVTLPPNAKNFEFLRNLPNLERLGFTEDSKTRLPDKTAAEFWQEFDAKK